MNKNKSGSKGNKKRILRFRHVNKEDLITALLNNKWDYRTVKGLSKELNMPEKEVEKCLESYPEVRKSIMKDRFGRSLYTLKKNKSIWGDIKSAFRAVNAAKLGN